MTVLSRDEGAHVEGVAVLGGDAVVLPEDEGGRVEDGAMLAEHERALVERGHMQGARPFFRRAARP